MLTLETLPALATSLATVLLANKAGLAANQPLPALSLRVRTVPIERRSVERYRAFFGFAAPLPIAWLYLPVQRAQLALINRSDFPLRALGLIHVANSISLIEPIDPAAGLGITVRVGQQKTRRHGRQFELVAELEQGGRLKAKLASTYLARTASAGRTPEASGAAAPPRRCEALTAIEVPAAMAWRYARLSGDWNPIHLHRWLARPLGLRQPIAHGMCVAALALASLEKQAGRSANRFDAQFLRPLPLGVRAGCFALEPAGPDEARAQVEVDGRCAQIVSARF